MAIERNPQGQNFKTEFYVAPAFRNENKEIKFITTQQGGRRESGKVQNCNRTLYPNSIFHLRLLLKQTFAAVPQGHVQTAGTPRLLK